MFSATTRPSFFAPSSHAASPQSVLSLINPVSSMALINRTLFTSYTWSARCLNLPAMSFPSLSFLLFPSIFFPSFSFFSFSFQHFIFSPSRSFYTSGFHTISVFEFDWLKSQLEGLAGSICARILHPIFTPSFFKVNFSFQWRFSMCERRVFSADYLPMNMIKVTEHLCVFTSAACMSALVCFCVLLFTEGTRMHMFSKKCHHTTPCM